MPDLHSSLKTEVISQHKQSGVEYAVVRLQDSKTAIRYSLHVNPRSYSTAGMQTTDLLALLGFAHTNCPIFRGACYVREVGGEFDLDGFTGAVSQGYSALAEAERHLSRCGIFLPQPGGWAHFGSGVPGKRYHTGWNDGGDGHTAPQTERMKEAQDAYFIYVFSWMTGGTNKGWTTHLHPKHPPLSDELLKALSFLEVRFFESCPQFDFESCNWWFTGFQQDGRSIFDSNAESAHRWFDSLAEHFGVGMEQLLAADRPFHPFGMRILPERRTAARTSAPIGRAAGTATSPRTATRAGYLPDKFDVALSFAGNQRPLAEELAQLVKEAGFDVFYDDFYPEHLWGKELPVVFDDIYRKRARYCVVFVSPQYVESMWTNVERRSAIARAVQEKGKEYILPIVVEMAEVPGLPPTIGYLPLDRYPVAMIAQLLTAKLATP